MPNLRRNLKMNRRHSSDSLDREEDDMIVSTASSSSGDFTSDEDDVANFKTLLRMTGRPAPAASLIRHLDNPYFDYRNLGKRLETDKVSDPNSQTSNKASQSQEAIVRTVANNHSDQSGPSTSWPITRIPDTVGLSPATSTLVDQPRYLPNRNLATTQVVDDEDEEEEVRYHHSAPLIVNSLDREMNTVTVRLCAKLVECRTMVEVVNFIETNHAIIERLTHIVTHEAPAYRDYDLSNYQIDQSVKESFNPNFWIDREPVVTTADGNCQYHAVSISLTGSEMYTSEVRLATAVAVVENRAYFESILKLIDRGTVLDLVHVIARCYSWGDETTLKAIAVAIKKRIFLYSCNIGKKDYEMVNTLTKEELIDAFKEKKYRGGTGIHTYADPLTHVSANNYIMLFHKSEHFIAVLPTSQQPTMFEPYNPIVPTFS